MNGKTQMLAVTALTVCAIGLGGSGRADQRPDASAPGGKSAEVVAIDAETKSITIKRPTVAAAGVDPETLAVEGKAVTILKDFKVGDKVVLTCKEGSGESATTASDASRPDTGSEAASETPKPCVVVDIAKAPEE